MDKACAWCDRLYHTPTYAPYCSARCQKKAEKALRAVSAEPVSHTTDETRAIRFGLISLVGIAAAGFAMLLLAGPVPLEPPPGHRPPGVPYALNTAPPPPPGLQTQATATTQADIPQLTPAQDMTAYHEGQNARRVWNRWIAGLSGERKRGALFWMQGALHHRTNPCDGTTGFAMGCFQARRHLSPILNRWDDAPDFWLGWNAS
ncbi:hypothetical protein [Acetobacter pomorum]